ncbi:MAG: NAD-dependent epimerase/dehydratase family protein [Abyssibacter sp.]|nr:NAD-dependent epimerase/dehydratase family protein [Abyssibacter sp.]MCK5857884.1 NAD-dependent epimerase/dehydratase family protein [Abyssibacter sp.]
MSTCVIFGGAGFIGGHLAKRLLSSGCFDHVHLADIRPSHLDGMAGVSTSITDVRDEIPEQLVPEPPGWIFNLAAVHREPGHEASEYFDTNLAGARTVTRYAEAVGCSNIYFTSSIAVYGPTTSATDESAPICPVSPYGGSKYPAELIHEQWQATQQGRRLVICRPGVIYGPGDPGNILRMIRAIKRGYLAYPGSPMVSKSYGYIEGLLDSIAIVMARNEPVIRYNYVEHPTEPLGDLVRHVKAHLGSRAPVLPLPVSLLAPAAAVLQIVTGGRGPIHPVRVKKAARPTHIVPRTLIDMGFDFRFDFASSLTDWQR